MTAGRAGARAVPVTAIAVLAVLLAGCGGSDGTRFSETTHPMTAAAGTSAAATGSGSPSASVSSSASGTASDLLPGTPPPWPNSEHPADMIKAAGLVAAGAEGNAEHYHAHLDILVDGVAVQVAAGIGIDEVERVISPLHTHDTTGVIHIETPTVGTPFYLGQLFKEWDVPLSARQLGGLRVDAGHTLVAYVAGEPLSGDPALIRLAKHQEIALVYGPAGSTPTVPKSYSFAAGV